MPRPDLSSIFQPVPGHDPEREVLALSERTLRVILVARALTDSERPVNLDGFEEQVGVLCAKALDLPLGRAGFAKLELRRLVQGLDALKNTMRNDFA